MGRPAALVIGLVCASGCAASPTQVGQTAGGILGSLLVPGIGTGLGTLVGTLAGLAVEGEMDKVRQNKERTELSEQLDSRSPRSASAASVPQRAEPLGRPARVWVDETVADGQVMAGRFEERAVP